MKARPRIFRGIGASPGIAIGRVFLLDRRRVRIPRYHIQVDQIEHEISRLEIAIQHSIDQLESIRNRFVGEGLDHQSILEAHELMLRDRALMDEASSIIRDKHYNAEWAVSRVTKRIRALFERVTDAYFRERQGDIDFIADRILRNLSGVNNEVVELRGIEDGTVVVAYELSPVDTALLSRQRITAFVTEVGGKTSHTSIIARSLEIPAVVGVRGIMDVIASGDLIVVDGIDGSVMIRPTHAQLDRGRCRSERYQRINLEMLEAKALPARTLDGKNFVIAGNIELPQEVGNILKRGGEAIGLFRTEFLFIGREDVPREDDHFNAYRKIFDEIGDKEVTIRTLDLGGDKIFAAAPTLGEPNPALGLRGIRYCLSDPDLFRNQIAGILRVASYGRVRILLPMISSMEELRLARSLIREVDTRLKQEGKSYRPDVPIGIMVEVPSAAMIANHLARECDFFSIGTNDLLQYVLAVDRCNEKVDYLYRPFHPAILRTLLMITETAHLADIPVAVCGEMAGDIYFTPIMVALGVHQMSMNAGSIPQIKRLIRELQANECQELMHEALNFDDSESIATLVHNFVHSKTATIRSLVNSE